MYLSSVFWALLIAMFIWNKKYFYFTLILLLIEVCIAVFVNESFIRPFIGDVLVVILIYCFVRAFCNIHSSILAFSILAFSCTIEILQYFNFVNKLGLQKYKILAVALGSTFDWKDIIAYTIGIITVLWLEKRTWLFGSCSYPYTSKYNPIEHRLFPHVTRACQGVVFESVEIVEELIAKTNTKSAFDNSWWANGIIIWASMKLSSPCNKEKLNSDLLISNKCFIYRKLGIFVAKYQILKLLRHRRLFKKQTTQHLVSLLTISKLSLQLGCRNRNQSDCKN